jgi:hypothetical protein
MNERAMFEKEKSKKANKQKARPLQVYSNDLPTNNDSLPVEPTRAITPTLSDSEVPDQDAMTDDEQRRGRNPFLAMMATKGAPNKPASRSKPTKKNAESGARSASASSPSRRSDTSPQRARSGARSTSRSTSCGTAAAQMNVADSTDTAMNDDGGSLPPPGGTIATPCSVHSASASSASTSILPGTTTDSAEPGASAPASHDSHTSNVLSSAPPLDPS